MLPAPGPEMCGSTGPTISCLRPRGHKPPCAAGFFGRVDVAWPIGRPWTALCGREHPHYGRLALCDLPLHHEGRHHADVDVPATGGWVGHMEWDDGTTWGDDGSIVEARRAQYIQAPRVYYEGHPDARFDLTNLDDRVPVPKETT